MESEYDINEYCGYLICRWSDLWEIRKGTDILGTEWTYDDACAFVDKLIRDKYTKRNPDKPL